MIGLNTPILLVLFYCAIARILIINTSQAFKGGVPSFVGTLFVKITFLISFLPKMAASFRFNTIYKEPVCCCLLLFAAASLESKFPKTFLKIPNLTSIVTSGFRSIHRIYIRKLEYLFGRPIIAYEFWIKVWRKAKVFLSSNFRNMGKSNVFFETREKCRFGYEKKPATIFFNNISFSKIF